MRISMPLNVTTFFLVKFRNPILTFYWICYVNSIHGNKRWITHPHETQFFKIRKTTVFFYINNDEGTSIKYSSVWEWPIYDYTSTTSNVHIIFLLTMVKTISINSQSVVSEWWVLEPHLLYKAYIYIHIYSLTSTYITKICLYITYESIRTLYKSPCV